MKLSHFFTPLLGVLLGIGSIRAFCHEFEVDGMMKVTSENFPPFSGPIRVFARDGQWAVFQFWEDPTNRIISEISDDGDYVYQLDRIETNHGNFMPDDYSQTFPNSLNGQIHPPHFPFEILNTKAIMLFYAYASSDYLNRHSNQVINWIPFYAGDESENHEGNFAFITRGPPPLSLPRQIVFRAEFQYVTNAIFTASGFTNVAGVQLPMCVRLSRYLPDSTNILTTFEFQATRISEKCSLKSFQPPLPGSALVTDCRSRHVFGRSPGAPRMTTNGWPVMPAN